MTLAALILMAVVALAAIAAALTVFRRSSLSHGPSLVGETIIVHTLDDRSIRGVVVGDHADRLILAQAVLLIGAGASSAIPDLAEISKPVSWWQRLSVTE